MVDHSKIIKSGTVSDHDASNGEGFIEIGLTVSEHRLVCNGFVGFWTDLDHLGWTNRKIIIIMLRFRPRCVEW